MKGDEGHRASAPAENTSRGLKGDPCRGKIEPPSYRDEPAHWRRLAEETRLHANRRSALHGYPIPRMLITV